MDDKIFLESCKKENAVLASIEEKETVSDETAYKALVIVKNMLVEGEGDALLYAASLNILNTYVKQSAQNKKTVGYSFKRNVDVLINYILNNPNENMQAEIQEDRGMSLCVVNIFSIQFSFHEVTITEINQVLKVKDPEHPRLPWDGIRKQMCSCTLFDFAYENTYKRTYKMLDGSDFVSGMNQLVNEYKAGTKSITDVLHAIYKKKGATPAESSTVSDVNIYPYKNKYIVPLMNLDGEELVEKIRERTLVPELNRKYQKQTGQHLSNANILSGKYAFETLLGILEDINLNPTTGISISFSKFPCREEFLVIMASCSENEERNLICLELLNWTSMKNKEDDFVSVYDESTGVYHTTRHPGFFKAYEYLSKFIPSFGLGNCNLNRCVYFFDAVKNENTDIISEVDKDKMTSLIFYASDREKLIDFIKPKLESGRGKMLISKFNDFRNFMTESNNDQLSNEHVVCTERCIEDLVNPNKTVNIVNYRRANDNTEFFDYFISQIKSSRLKYTLFTGADNACKEKTADIAIFCDCIPKEDVADMYDKIVILCDLYTPLKSLHEQYEDFVRCAYEKGFLIHRTSIVNALGFADGGCGNNYLLRYLGLAEIDKRMWISDKYPIYIVDSEKEMIDGNEIKNVVINESIGLDCDKKCINATDEEKEKLYRELLNAPKGVRFLIKNSVLKHYFEDCICQINDYTKWADDAKNSLDDSFVKLIQFLKSQANKSSNYNEYQSLAIEYLKKENWDKLSGESQDWVVTSLSSYYGMKSNDTSMDFSGIALLVSKTFEVELGARISERYAEYLKNKYGDNYIDELPEPLISVKPDGIRPADPKTVTLGSMPFIMGLDSKGNIKDKKSYNNFLAYCNDEALVNPKSADRDLKKLCDIIFYVRVNFRNTSAHKTAISYESATDCIKYCLSEKCALGTVLDMFKD